jgi:hypothetical protein
MYLHLLFGCKAIQSNRFATLIQFSSHMLYGTYCLRAPHSHSSFSLEQPS